MERVSSPLFVWTGVVAYHIRAWYALNMPQERRTLIIAAYVGAIEMSPLH